MSRVTRLHLRNNRLAKGDDALSSRHPHVIADGYARHISEVRPEDVFTYLSDCLHLRTTGTRRFSAPLRLRRADRNRNPAEPPLRLIETYKATVCLTALTAYRAMLAAMDEGADLSPLRALCPQARTLPAPVYDAWTKRTGVLILDGNTRRKCCMCSSAAVLMIEGRASPGLLRRYEAKIVDMI